MFNIKSFFLRFFNDTLKNASKLLAGTLIAQAIPLVFSFLISRIFNETAFAYFGFYTSYISIFVVLVNLKYETTIMLPKEDKDADTLVGVSIFFAFITSLLFTLYLVLYRIDMIPWLSWSNDKQWLYFVPFSLFIIGIYQPFSYWLLRFKRYNESSINKITQRIAETPFNILFGFKKVTVGLIWGDILGKLFMTFQSIRQSVNAGFSLRNTTKADFNRLLNRYRSNAIYNSLPSLANNIATHAPLFFVERFYGIGLAGQMTLVRTVLSIPVSLVSNNISQVIYQQVSERVSHNKEFTMVLRNVFLLLFGLSVVMIVLFLQFGQFIFKLYGTQWSMAGFMSQILVVSFSVKFLISSFSKILLSLEKIAWISFWQILYLLMIIGLYYITKYFALTLTNFLFLYLVVDVLAYLIYAYIIIKAVKTYHATLQI